MHDDPAMAPPSPVQAQDAEPATIDPGEAPRPASMGEYRSGNDRVCPFLRSVDEDDQLGYPLESPDPANRCAALRDPVPQSLRQQELVCLTAGHVNCPRYLRGSMGPIAPVEPVPGARVVSPAIAAALAVLVAAFLLSVAFVFSNGGLALTAAAPTPRPTGSAAVAVVATASPAPTASSAPTSLPPASASPSIEPSASPTAAPSDTPAPSSTPLPTASPVATPSPGAQATPKPAGSRAAGLAQCPDQPDCYIYRIKSGDNLYSIARYFGVPLATVKAWNPWTASGLKIGRSLRIPTPTK